MLISAALHWREQAKIQTGFRYGPLWVIWLKPKLVYQHGLLGIDRPLVVDSGLYAFSCRSQHSRD